MLGDHPIHPVLLAKDLAAAREFYHDKVGLEILMENRNRVLTRQTLIDRVWGYDYVGDTKTLDVHVKRLRSRVEEDRHEPRLIVTVRGVGYRFDG